MSHLQYKSYPGFGQYNYENAHYSSAVRIPPGETVTISGQGGWDRSNGEVRKDLKEEISQAFENVHAALVHEGGPGMSSVYKIVSYHVALGDEAMGFAVESMKEWFPDHRPLWTVIGVEKLALPKMRIEIEAWAHVG